MGFYWRWASPSSPATGRFTPHISLWCSEFDRRCRGRSLVTKTPVVVAWGYSGYRGWSCHGCAAAVCWSWGISIDIHLSYENCIQFQLWAWICEVSCQWCFTFESKRRGLLKAHLEDVRSVPLNVFGVLLFWIFSPNPKIRRWGALLKIYSTLLNICPFGQVWFVLI